MFRSEIDRQIAHGRDGQTRKADHERPIAVGERREQDHPDRQGAHLEETEQAGGRGRKVEAVDERAHLQWHGAGAQVRHRVTHRHGEDEGNQSHRAL